MSETTDTQYYTPPEVLCEMCEQLQRELSVAREEIDMLQIRHGATMLYHRAQVDELTAQRDNLAEAMIPAMTRAYARGYNHGHEDTVESTFMTTHASDELTFFADDIRKMLIDGSQPEAQAALAAVKGGER